MSLVATLFEDSYSETSDRRHSERGHTFQQLQRTSQQYPCIHTL